MKMKCPRCNGNGSVLYPIDYEQGLFDETNCPLCGGSGEFDPNEVDRFNAVDVIKVMEMVKEPMTNEEYIRNCSTGELAEFIYKLARCCRYSCKECPLNGYCAVENSRDALAWLKEKHHE